MAIPAGTVWEVRPTVGADVNGAGFVAGASGTDFSQQNAPNPGGNNGSTTDAVAVGTTTLTSATGNFTAAIVGNLIFLSGPGVTTGWYQAVAFTNATTITLDRSPGTGTGLTMNIGGALATIGALAGNYTNGNTIFVKATGTLTQTAVTVLGEGVTITGYTASRGDGGQFTVTTATDSTGLFELDNQVVYQFFNVIATNTASTRAACFVPANASFSIQLQCVNCSFSGFTTLHTLDANSILVNPFVLDTCEVKDCTGVGVNWSGSNVATRFYFEACYIHDNGSHGINIAAQSLETEIDRSVVANNGGDGLTLSSFSNVKIYNAAFVNNVGDGITNSMDAGFILFWNVIFSVNGGWGINAGGSSSVLQNVRNCAFNANPSGEFTGVSPTPSQTVTLSGDPFVNAAAGNYNLNDTAGAGAACRGAGYPAALP